MGHVLPKLVLVGSVLHILEILVVDISLTDITPGRQVNTAEDQRVFRGFMVADHMGIDIATAVHLIASQTHPVLLDCSTGLTRLGHI